MSIKVEEFAYSNGEDDSRLEMERLIRLAKQEVLGKRGGSELLARLETIASSLQIEKTWLAYFDEVPVGFLIARIQTSPSASSTMIGQEPSNTDKKEIIGQLVALFVHQEARRIGIAGELYKSCAGWFFDQGVERAEATALPGDIAMKAFFESYGYKAISLTMGSVQPFSQVAD